MRIIHLSTELAPIARAGGLADITYGLSKAHLAMGLDVSVFLPLYDCIDTSQIRGFQPIGPRFPVQFGNSSHEVSVWRGNICGVPLFLIEGFAKFAPFKRGKIYGCEDDASRFLAFSKACMEAIDTLELFPDILHLHDWPTSIAAPLYKRHYSSTWPEESAIVSTIHNFSHQGISPKEVVEQVGISFEEDPVNLLAQALEYSDAINTVSPTHAREVLEPHHGHGLEKILQQRGNSFRGILNGLDDEYWNPATDPFLSIHFSLESLRKDPGETLPPEGKLRHKRRLQHMVGLAEEDRPLFCSVSRLVPQKGLPLLKHALEYASKKGVQFILMGESPIEKVQREYEQLAAYYANHPHIQVKPISHEALAHQVFAGSDLFVITSQFEPCGLTQMIAMRYGTIAIARRTGGLNDTVHDFDRSVRPPPERNGYLFADPTPKALEEAMDRAIETWQNHKERWRKLMFQAMSQDFSWRRPASQYLDLYEFALQLDRESSLLLPS